MRQFLLLGFLFGAAIGDICPMLAKLKRVQQPSIFYACLIMINLIDCRKFYLVLKLHSPAIEMSAMPPYNLIRVLDDRIINGTSAQLGQFPYQISLRLAASNHHYCGGSILNNRWIVTAAHCVSRRQPEDFRVVTGSVSLEKGGDVYRVSRIIMHDKYNDSSLVNDIALLRTNKDITFNEYVKPITLGRFELYSDYNVVVSGWGKSGPGMYPDQLQYLPLVTITNKQCYKASNSIRKNHLCTIAKSGSGVCSGDSGGPLVYYGHLVGIVSGVIKCAQNYPDVFTRVSPYIPWIEKHMKAHSPKDIALTI